MIYSQNEEELISIGQKLGRLLDSGDIIVLSGDLGAGKTTLTNGDCQRFGYFTDDKESNLYYCKGV